MGLAERLHKVLSKHRIGSNLEQLVPCFQIHYGFDYNLVQFSIFYYVALKALVGFKVAFKHKTRPIFPRPRVTESDFLFEREMFVP